MKNSFFSKLLATAAATAAFLFIACNPTPSTDKTVKAHENTESPKDTLQLKAYVCPMGPQCGQSDSSGKCPSCGMDMKPNPDFKK